MWWWRGWVVSLIVGVVVEAGVDWKCPETGPVSCSCDLPHTLRCTGDRSALDTVAERLRGLPPSASVSLLDCTVQNISVLSGPLLKVGPSRFFRKILLISVVSKQFESYFCKKGM